MDQTIQEKVQCEATTKSGNRCKRQTIKYSRYCFQHAKELQGLQINPSTIPEAGNGLFASRDLPSNYKIDYARDIDKMTRNEVEERYPGDTVGQYVLCERQECWDARSTQAGLGRYINHRSRRPNCKFIVYKGKSYLRTTRKVKKGEELLVSYGRKFFIEKPKEPEQQPTDQQYLQMYKKMFNDIKKKVKSPYKASALETITLLKQSADEPGLSKVERDLRNHVAEYIQQKPETFANMRMHNIYIHAIKDFISYLKSKST